MEGAHSADADAVAGHHDVIARAEADDSPTFGTFVIVRETPGSVWIRSITRRGVETPEERHGKETRV